MQGVVLHNSVMGWPKLALSGLLFTSAGEFVCRLFLDAGLRWLTERFGDRTGVHVTYQSSFHDRLDDVSETHLFRISQEALTNIARHSGATDASVRLEALENTVRLTIEDNGQGIRTSENGYTPSLGMTGMRARAREAGGSFQLSKPDGGGLRIEVEVPRTVPEETHAG